MPKVSVIIPAHNCKIYLPDALETVRVQGVDDLEVVIVDDGSTDDTWEYLQQAKEEMPFSLVLLQLGGEGPGAARNAAIEAATGDYLAFLDADDRWTDNKLRDQLAFHDANPDAVLSFTNYLHVTPENEDLGECYPYWPKFYEEVSTSKGYRLLGKRAPALVFAENVVGTSTVVAKRSMVQEKNGFDATLRSAQDWDFWLRLSLAGPVGCTDAVDGFYLMRPGSVTGNVPLRLKCMREVIARYEQEIMDIDVDCAAAAHARVFTGEAEYARSEGKFCSAFSWHVKAYFRSPSYRVFRAMASDFVSIFKRR